jgi:hypothetical protein
MAKNKERKKKMNGKISDDDEENYMYGEGHMEKT